MILLAAAVGALVGAILGSLDSCSSEIRNVTTTTETVTPLATSLLLDGSGSMGSNNKWNDAINSLPVLVNAFDYAMNNGSNTANKFSVSLVQWADVNQFASYLDQTTNMSTVAGGISAMNSGFFSGPSTVWGPGLCECYAQLESGPNAATSNKLCILMSDGGLISNALASSTSCTALQNACSGTPTDEQAAADCLKNELNYQIFGILVGASSGFSTVRDTSSCNSTNCVSTTDCSCDYFLFLQDFAELAARSTTISSYQRSISVSTLQIQTSSSVSVCSLDFLYALTAFGPFLAYLIYRVVMIKAKSKSIRKQLYEMIRNGELSRDDIRHFATVAANLLLPKNFKSDVDWIISYVMFQCPCLLPASRSDLEAVFAASTIAL